MNPRHTFRQRVIILALIGVFALVGKALVPAGSALPTEHGAGITLNIAGVGLSAHVSIH